MKSTKERGMAAAAASDWMGDGMGRHLFRLIRENKEEKRCQKSLARFQADLRDVVHAAAKPFRMEPRRKTSSTSALYGAGDGAAERALGLWFRQ